MKNNTHRTALGIKSLIPLLLATGIAIGKAATTWYVSPSGNDANSGLNWGAAKQTVQAAVNLTANNDTVLVTNGVYSLTAPVTVTNVILLTSVNGAGATILDGQQIAGCVRINGSAATLNGFTLRNGRAINGGGIYCNAGTIQNCVLTSNQAIGSDVSDGMGGGAYVAYGTMSNCVAYANTAQTTNDYQTSWGGGVYSYGSILQSCVVSNNLCTGYNANGGGVTLVGGTLRNSRVAGNSAVALEYASGGGGYATILQLSVSSFIEACIITNNSVTTTDTYVYSAASASGGGLYIGSGTDVRSTLIAGNIAHSAAGFTSGGGVWTSGSILENCTVAYNTATTQYGNAGSGGGVIWGYNDQCYNNLVKLNTAANGADNSEVNVLSYPMFFNSDIGATVPAPNQINCSSVDPLFVNAGGGDFRLQSGSPCRDAGTNLIWMTAALDLVGNPRIIGGKGDIGAFEYVAASPPMLTVNRSGGSIVLSWPTNATGFALWWATNLPATSWSSNAVPPTVLNGQYTITEATAGVRKFYRLSK